MPYPCYLRKPLLLAAWLLFFLSLSPVFAWTELTTMPPGPDAGSSCDFHSEAECTDRVNFSLSGFDTWFGTWVYGSTQGPDLLVNVRQSNGVWRWNPSKQIVDFRDYGDPEATISSSAVIATGTARFVSPVNGHAYKRILYLVYESEIETTSGGVCVMFSDEDAGWVWTDPINVVKQASSPARGQLCGTNGGPEVQLEAVAGFLLNNELQIFGPDGDVNKLLMGISKPNTLTYHYTAAQSTPDILQKQGELTSNGLSKIRRSGDDYYNFFINMDAAYDIGTGTFYATAMYPFPLDIDDDLTPCYIPTSGSAPPGLVAGGISACPSSAATFPNRAQVYSMDIDGDFSKLYIGSSQSFNLVADFGDRTGWADQSTGSCQYASVTECHDKRWDTPLDYDSLDFFTTPTGILARFGVDNDELLLLGSAPSQFFAPVELSNVDRQDLCDLATEKIGQVKGQAKGTFNYMGIYWAYYDLNPGVTAIVCP